MPPHVSSSLVEPGAQWLMDVSPDGAQALVSHQRKAYSPYGSGDIVLVSQLAPPRTLAASGGAWAQFSPDGRSIVYNDAAAVPGNLNLAAADGSGARLLASKQTRYAFAGRWLYYVDESGTDASLYRLAAPDGAPELIAAFTPPHSATGSIYVAPSPDGDSVAYCHIDDKLAMQCFVHSAGVAAPLTDSSGYPSWTRDGKWVVVAGCDVYDRSGAHSLVCGKGVARPSPDSTMWASCFNTFGLAPTKLPPVGLEIYSMIEHAAYPVDVPQPFNSNVRKPAAALFFTPDGSRLIATLGASSFVKSAAREGGPWTAISTDNTLPYRGNLFVSPDSRIIADTSESNGLVMSVDGQAAYAVTAPGSAAPSVSGVVFEPAGGLDKALFFGLAGGVWLANADATGDWLELGAGTSACQWAGRAAVCFKPAANVQATTFDLIVATDDGAQNGAARADAREWIVKGSRIFYIASAGNLYVANLPQP